MTLRPTKLELAAPDQLRITWSDQTTHTLSATALRDACPCASCREQRAAPPPDHGSLPVLSLAEAQPVRIVTMRPVGNYAYGIQFSDGHDTGIFTLETLHRLGAGGKDD